VPISPELEFKDSIEAVAMSQLLYRTRNTYILKPRPQNNILRNEIISKLLNNLDYLPSNLLSWNVQKPLP